MIVGVDIDGVVANFFKAYEDLTVETAGKDLFPARYPEALPCTWNWPEHYGYHKEIMQAVWRQIKESREFWLKLQPLPGAVKFLNNLYLSDHEVYFITDRPGPNPQDQTRDWLMFHGYPEPAVIISRRGKGSVCKALSIDVYIDDKPENVENVWAESPSTKVYMLKYPYNERLHGMDLSVNSLTEFEEKAGI